MAATRAADVRIGVGEVRGDLRKLARPGLLMQNSSFTIKMQYLKQKILAQPGLATITFVTITSSFLVQNYRFVDSHSPAHGGGTRTGLAVVRPKPIIFSTKSHQF